MNRLYGLVTGRLKKTTPRAASAGVAVSGVVRLIVVDMIVVDASAAAGIVVDAIGVTGTIVPAIKEAGTMATATMSEASVDRARIKVPIANSAPASVRAANRAMTPPASIRRHGRNARAIPRPRAKPVSNTSANPAASLNARHVPPSGREQR